jgi:hypothetical protein
VVRVEWEGADADGDALVYNVFTATGDGGAWQIRAVEQTDNYVEMDLAAGTHVVRVLASDGGRSAEAIITVAVI